MKQICPCCNEEFVPPDHSNGMEKDIGSLFSCDHCQSVLKWEGDLLKVVHKSYLEPKIDNGTNDVKIQRDVQQKKEELKTDFMVEDNKKEEVVQDFEDKKEDFKNELEKSFMKDQKPQEIEGVSDETIEESFKDATEDHKDFSSVSSEQEYNLGDNEKGKELNIANEEGEVQKKQEAEWEMIDKEDEVQETNQDFSDVEEYGNAQTTSEKGFLRYDIYISGLDSVEIERQIQEVLEDPRFKWDVNEILESQDKGHLVIKNLNPIKAACLVSELSFLSIKISWKQYMALNVKPEQTEE